MKFLTLAVLALSLPSLAAMKADADRDGISDLLDKCPRTPGNSTVNSYGCRAGEKVVQSLDVNFATDSTVVGQEYRYQVEQLADFMKRNPQTEIEIKGYADPRGEVPHNKYLSRRRAEAIKKMLVEDYNVPSARVDVAGLGESSRVTPHKGLEGNYRNRRVEVRIIE